MNTIKQPLSKDELQELRDKEIRLHVTNTRTAKKYSFVVPPLKFSQQKKIVDALIGIENFGATSSLFDVFITLLDKHYDCIVYAVAVATIDPGVDPSRKYMKFIADIMNNEDLFKLWTIVLRQFNPAPLVVGLARMKGIDLTEN